MNTVVNVGFTKHFLLTSSQKIYYGAGGIAHWVKPLAKEV